MQIPLDPDSPRHLWLCLLHSLAAGSHGKPGSKVQAVVLVSVHVGLTVNSGQVGFKCRGQTAAQKSKALQGKYLLLE